MKALKVVGLILAVVVVLGGVGLFLVNRYIQAPAFKQTALAAARTALGAEVQLADLELSVFSGVTLRGIKVANPTGFAGNLLEAQRFVIHYRLWPLLHRRVVIRELTLDQPTIALVQNDQGQWNYEALGGEKAKASPPAGAGATPTSSTSTSTATRGSTRGLGGLAVTLERLALNGGAVVLRKANGQPVVEVQQLSVHSSAEFVGDRLGGAGEAQIGTLNVANALLVRALRATITITPEQVALAPLTAKLADGKLSGSLTVQLEPAFKYLVDLQIKDGDVAKLLQEAGAKQLLTGKLQANTKLAGTSGLDTIHGAGRAEIVGGQLQEIPLLKKVGALLQIPELQDLKFDECVIEFTMADNQVTTSVIRLTSPKIKLTGKGVVDLGDKSLNHDMTLAIDPSLLARLPKEVRSAFTAGDDGFLAIDFKVTGPYDHPKTDLPNRLLNGAAGDLIQKNLKKWLR